MLFAFVAVASFAQTSTRQVTIHVMDVIGEPLIGAKVEIVGSDQRHIFWDQKIDIAVKKWQNYLQNLLLSFCA